jgi:YidC/Oxa1 family membrane protein insertase
MQTQRTILWVIFTMSLLFLWDAWQRNQGHPSLFGGSTATQQQPAPGVPGAAVAPGKTESSVPPVGSAAVPSLPAAAGSSAVPGAVSASSASAASAAVRVTTDVFAIDIDPVGGELIRAELLLYKDTDSKTGNVMLFDRRVGHTYVAQSGLIGAGAAAFPTHRTPFEVLPGPRSLVPGTDELAVTMVAESGGAKVVRRYVFRRGAYQIDMKTEVTNTGEAPIRPTLYLQLTRDATAPPGESQFYSTYTGPVVYTDKDKFQKVDFSSIEKGKTEHAKAANDGWVGMIQHYFVSAWVPTEALPREYFTRKVDAAVYSVGVLEPMKDIAPGATESMNTKLYVGPQDQKVLAEVAPGLELSVDYGWLTVFAKPLFWLLQFLHGVVQNWGWAIVLLTIVVKLAFFPLQAASYRSMAKMKKVTPKLMQLRERFGSDRAKLNQAMMELYKTEKINPLGGCLPIVVQIPVFIALYWVLLASVEMRNAPWVGWIRDLAVPDPFYILPVLMAVTMFIQTRLNPTPPDPLQAKMMLWMPLIFSVMFFFFPAGLVLYWLVNNLFSIAQQWVITRRIEGKPVFGRAPA